MPKIILAPPTEGPFFFVLLGGEGAFSGEEKLQGILALPLARS